MMIKDFKKDNISEIYSAECDSRVVINHFSSAIPAGFPSPAEDYIDKSIDLNEHLIKHPSSTFFVRIIGDSMNNAGIHSGDLIVVDRSIAPVHNKIVLAIIDGEFTVKRLILQNNRVFLRPENDNYKEIEITEGIDFEVWGVVTSVIKEV